MRNPDGSNGEVPVSHLWYGKHAFRPIEEIIDKWPDYFIWIVERFQDITPFQAQYFKEKYGMEIPDTYIKDVPLYVYNKETKGQDYPESDYNKWKEMCNEKDN